MSEIEDISRGLGANYCEHRNDRNEIDKIWVDNEYLYHRVCLFFSRFNAEKLSGCGQVIAGQQDLKASNAGLR